jgi:AI-2 transport protein TqsA
MTAKTKPASILNLLIAGASFVIIVAGMQASAPILNSFFLALMITIAITPFLTWLRKKRLPVWLALLVTILLVLLTGVTLISFMGISVAQLLHILPTYEVRIAGIKESLIDFLAAKGFDISAAFSLDSLSPARLIKAIATFLSTVGQALSTSLLLLFVVAFMLIEANGFPTKLQRGLNPNSPVLKKIHEFTQSIRSYVVITTWTGGLTALIDFGILIALGIDLATLWGILFFLLNFVPAVGFLMAVIPPMLLALLKFGPDKALLVFFCCWLVDNAIDKGIKPRYMQQGLDLSPLVIILSVIFWSWVLGPTGAILAVPVTLGFKKIVLENFEQTQLLAELMGAGLSSSEAEPPAPSLSQQR